MAHWLTLRTLNALPRYDWSLESYFVIHPSNWRTGKHNNSPTRADQHLQFNYGTHPSRQCVLVSNVQSWNLFAGVYGFVHVVCFPSIRCCECRAMRLVITIYFATTCVLFIVHVFLFHSISSGTSSNSRLLCAQWWISCDNVVTVQRDWSE